jgi:hypothetical protein
MKSRYPPNPFVNGSDDAPWAVVDVVDEVMENAPLPASPASHRASSDSCLLGFKRRRAARVASLDRAHDSASVTCVGAFNVDITFQADPVQLQVLPDRFVAATRVPSEAPLLRDRVVEALRSLETAPVCRVELNRHLHFRLGSEEELRRVTRSFAPIDLWQRHLIDPALLSLTIKEARTNVMPGQLEVHITASSSEREVIEVTLSHHFELPPESAAPAAATLIAERWDDVMGTAMVVAEELIADVLNER